VAMLVLLRRLCCKLLSLPLALLPLLPLALPPKLHARLAQRRRMLGRPWRGSYLTQEVVAAINGWLAYSCPHQLPQPFLPGLQEGGSRLCY
jgi:hypothetical protein